MICPNCGAENREDYKFCGNCGTPRAGEHAVLGTVIVPEAQYQPPPPYDAAQPPYGTPAPQPSVVVPAAPVKPRRRGKWLLTCGIIVVVLICLAVVAVGVIAFVKPELLPFDIPFLSSNNRILVGFPNRN